MRHLAVVFLLAAACHETDAEQRPATTSTESASTSVTASNQPVTTSADALPTTSAAEIGTVSHGIGGLDWGDSRDPRKPRGPAIRMGATSVTGNLPPEVIQRIVRRNFAKLRTCYEPALLKQPAPTGRTSTSFTIDPSGKVKDVKTTGDLGDKDVLACIEKAFAGLSYPAPESGSVKVTYPAVFSPPEYRFKIGDKNSIHVGEADLVKALEKAGYKVIGAASASEPSAAVSRFKAEKDGITFSLTLDPAAKLPLESYEALKLEALMLEDGAWCLFVASNDVKASRALLDAIHKKLGKQ